MKFVSLFILTIALLLGIAGTTQAQYPKRTDGVWARTAPAGSIKMDGVLNEPEWAKAESLKVVYGVPGQLPTSGYRSEFNPDLAKDSTRATVKFLFCDGYLYLGFEIPDSSIGGSVDWARWDGIIMSIKNKLSKDRPIAPIELSYLWWYANVPQYVKPGCPPRFIGNEYGDYNDTTRTDAQRAVWDAVTIVHGLSNDDTNPDTGWTVEMRIKLSAMGYTPTAPQGDIVEFNFSIWDCDNAWGTDASRINTTRTHFQSPWGNNNSNNTGRIYVSPDVTTATAVLPDVQPDVVIPSAGSAKLPTIDGKLTEDVWKGAYSFDIAWADSNVRKTYPGIGPYISGQYQPQLYGNPISPVLDPSFATVKMFFKDHYLYLGADVKDMLVQGTEVFDKTDGIMFNIGHRTSLNAENVMTFLKVRVSYDATGKAAAYDYLPGLVDSSAAIWASAIKGGTTVNNNSDIDSGYSVEMRLDLTKLGYPSDLGDKLLFMGVVLSDGDSFDDSLANYGTRTWWFREHDGGPACAWMVMDPTKVISDVKDASRISIPSGIELVGNYPNPFNPTTNISFKMPFNGDASLRVFTTLGEEVFKTTLTGLHAGLNEYKFNPAGMASGVYFYQVTSLGRGESGTMKSNVAKMLLMK